MKIAIGCDHGGIAAKNAIIDFMSKNGIEYINLGTDTTDSVDYPVYAKAVAAKVQSGECKYGVLCCTTGVGMAIVANKQKGIRSANISDKISAEMCRKHNDTNVICFGSGLLKSEDIVDYFNIFINTEFEGGRHKKRVDMFE
ncbi:ribose 5-phosphate isomerase B [Eubacteriales bacterium OttesenSCG-928-G02]|nr:ribose 5-phosphate isomerase B [Eubacteriales bacterium OttesenSCG-928-G02]